jgi:hypothetical protein
MHLVSKVEVKVSGIEKLIADATARPPFGPGFLVSDLERAEALECHGTSFSDPGPDYCEFRLLDADGEVLKVKRVGGY